jgi:putative transposase
MLKALKIRLYPTSKQKSILNSHFGSCRFVYNQALNFKKTQWETLKTRYSKFDMINWVTNLRKNEEFSWLQDIKCEVLQNQVDGLDNAFKGFFRGNGYPKFKKKSSKQSFTTKQTFKILSNTNRLVFFGEKIKYITYSKNSCNQYWASVLVEYIPKIEERSGINDEIGIDLGLNHFLVTSKKQFTENPRFFRKSKIKLAKQQKSFSRKKKDSKNREKARIKVAKIHQKITNQRNHFFHDLSNQLINENQVISLETLRVKNMLKNEKLAMSISDASWSKFVNMLQYKAIKNGVEIRRIDTFCPSTKTCSSCGNVQEMSLKQRTYECGNCGLVIDRDINAAINILAFSKNQNRDELTRINATGRKPIRARLNVEENVYFFYTNS